VGYVALGGGYRLQVDGLTHEDDRPFLIMSAHFSFNDYGSRVLAKANEENARVPLASKTFRVPIVDGELDLPIKEIERGDVATTSEAIDLVLSELFTKYGKAINDLTRDLLTIREAMRMHQFEGIYGVREEIGVSVEVIDFDGLDTYDLRPEMELYSPGERLVGGERAKRFAYLPSLIYCRRGYAQKGTAEGVEGGREANCRSAATVAEWASRQSEAEGVLATYNVHSKKEASVQEISIDGGIGLLAEAWERHV